MFSRRQVIGSVIIAHTVFDTPQKTTELLHSAADKINDVPAETPRQFRGGVYNEIYNI